MSQSEMYVQVEHSDDWLINKWSKVIDNVANVPADMQEKVGIIVKFFDAGVDLLRDPQVTPNLAINQLMTLAWRLIGNKVTPTAIVEKMPFGHPETLHFWGEIKSDKRLGIVMVPYEWDKMCKEDRFMQLGGLVFVASQCADFWSGMMQPPQKGQESPVIKRSRAYEAEYLRTLAGYPDFKPNNYQKQVLELYPNGLDSLEAECRYELKPYLPEDFVILKLGSKVMGPNG